MFFARKGLGPKGQESLAQGLPWVLGLSPKALKGGATDETPRKPHLGMPVPLQGICHIKTRFPG